MTDHDINIAIAEACGNAVFENTVGYLHQREDGEPEFVPTGDLPDYPNDLNAMHEAEESLFPKEVSQLSGPDRVAIYHAVLCKLCIGNSGFTFRSTARQRAEAFLKTIGKWKE